MKAILIRFLQLAILPVLLFIGINGWGQILTFEFSSLTGSEVTANSNYNHANLSSSTISRGTGLSASNNAGRFNATSWALTSIANAVTGNDYMEFTITPNSGYQFSISSVFIALQRSLTGPSGIAIRSSLDSYASNLDQEYSITDNTNTQTFTFTFAQSNSSSPVTYRIYMWAEGTTGSGGIGDYTGNDIVVNGTVSSTTILPEPSNHASTFAVTTSSTTHGSITLTWLDNDGTQAADGFLVKASDVGYSSITGPVDGTAESDGTLVKNVAHGIQTVVFTGLTASTTYYFKIWPYTNSGSNIDYKTSGTIPTATETTSSISAWINEFHYDNDGTDQGEFVEVCIKDASTYNLSDFTLYLYNGNGGASYDNDGLNTFTAGTTYDDVKVYYLDYSSGGIQNGPDGIALSWNDGSKGEILLEFISYEGSFAGTSGPANGVTSTDIGVSESTTATVGTSIGRVGTNDDNNWEEGNAASKGSKNNKSGGGYQVLPIHLIHFSAVQSNNSIKLKWQTTAEINNNFFTIERSDNGKNFYGIGIVEAAGNSNTVLDYSFVDESKFSNTVYYRLKQTDYDGKFTYSNIISVSEANQDFVVNNIYASTENKLVIDLYSNARNKTEIQVLNTMGQVVANKSLEVSKGNGIYSITLPNLSQGIYFIKVNTENFSSCSKVKL